MKKPKKKPTQNKQAVKKRSRFKKTHAAKKAPKGKRLPTQTAVARKTGKGKPAKNKVRRIQKAVASPAKRTTAAPVRYIKVKSNRYGYHERAKRGTFKVAKLNKSLEKSAGETGLLNKIAKSIRDPFVPFLTNMAHGTTWPRLLACIKPQLSRNNKFDFATLIDFEFGDECLLDKLYSVKRAFKRNGPTLADLMITLTCKLGLARERVDNTRMTIVIAFYGNNTTNTFSQRAILPLEKYGTQTHKSSWEIPPDTTHCVIAVKCEFFFGNYPATTKNKLGMKIIDYERFTPVI